MFKIFILSLILSSTLSYSIPSYVHLCKRNDPELAKCFVNTANELRPYLKKGIPEMNILPMEPYKIDSIKVNLNGTNADINIEVFDGTFENISSYNFTSFTIDLNKGFFGGQSIFKYMKLNTKYRLKGKLMLFNIDSEGNLKLDIGELIVNAKWFATTYKKEDKEYFKFNYANVTMKSLDFKIQFDNVFKDKALSDHFNSIINDNIDALLPELAPIIGQTISSLSLENLNNIYDVFPVDVLYPND